MMKAPVMMKTKLLSRLFRLLCALIASCYVYHTGQAPLGLIYFTYSVLDDSSTCNGYELVILLPSGASGAVERCVNAAT